MTTNDEPGEPAAQGATLGPAGPLVWVHLGNPEARFLSCVGCCGGMGTDAHLREFLYLEAGPPRCARCGWGPLDWLEARDRAVADERAWRVALNARGRAVLTPELEASRG